jgi:hypothetical protein
VAARRVCGAMTTGERNSQPTFLGVTMGCSRDRREDVVSVAFCSAVAWGSGALQSGLPVGAEPESRNGVGVSPSESKANSQSPVAGTRWEGRFSLAKCGGGKKGCSSPPSTRVGYVCLDRRRFDPSEPYSEVYRAAMAKMHCSCAASYVQRERGIQGERGREDCSTADDFVSKAPHSVRKRN